MDHREHFKYEPFEALIFLSDVSHIHLNSTHSTKIQSKFLCFCCSRVLVLCLLGLFFS